MIPLDSIIQLFLFYGVLSDFCSSLRLLRRRLNVTGVMPKKEAICNWHSFLNTKNNIRNTHLSKLISVSTSTSGGNTPRPRKSANSIRKLIYTCFTPACLTSR